MSQSPSFLRGLPCLLQALAMSAVRLRIGPEVFFGQNLDQLRHTIPQRLRSFQLCARFYVALGAVAESFGPAAPLRLAPAAGVEQLVLRPLAPSARNILGLLVQPINSVPRLRSSLLMRNPFLFAAIRGTP